MRWRTIAVAGLGFTAACSDDASLLDELDAHQGAHLTYYSSASLQACAGTYEHVDNFLPFVAGELGLSLPADTRYLWLAHEDFPRSGCGPGLGGCALAGAGVGKSPALLHELVHVVAAEHSLNSWPFFAEGLATAYDPWSGESMGPRYSISPQGGALIDPRPMMERPAADVDYGLAGSFVSFLIARHGPEPLVATLQELSGRPRTLGTLRRVFGEIYGLDLDAEVELFIGGTTCPTEPWPTLVYECAAPEVAWEDGSRWRYSKAMECGSDTVMGGVGPEKAWKSIHSVTLDVASSGAYQVSVESDGDVEVQIGACFGCPWEPRWVWLGSGEQVSVELDPGKYYVRMRAVSDESPRIDLSIDRAP